MARGQPAREVLGLDQLDPGDADADAGMDPLALEGLDDASGPRAGKLSPQPSVIGATVAVLADEAQPDTLGLFRAVATSEQQPDSIRQMALELASASSRGPRWHS